MIKEKINLDWEMFHNAGGEEVNEFSALLVVPLADGEVTSQVRKAPEIKFNTDGARFDPKNVYKDLFIHEECLSRENLSDP